MERQELHGNRKPHGNTVVWRYSTLEKFLDILINKRLFFCRASLLTDKYEVLPTRQDYDRWSKAQLDRTRDGPEADSAVYRYFNAFFERRDRTVVNSWSRGPDESYALWKIYLQGGSSGVAIRTTVSKLQRALMVGNEPVQIAKVRYSWTFETDSPPWYEVVTRKAPPYAYEREIRCFMLLEPSSSIRSPEQPPLIPAPGVHVQVNVDELVDELYVSPFAGKWVKDVLHGVCERIAPTLCDRIRNSAVRDS